MPDLAAREQTIRDHRCPRLGYPIGYYIDKGLLRIQWWPSLADVPDRIEAVHGGVYHEDGSWFAVVAT